MKIIPGNALVQTTPGAAARPDQPAPRPEGAVNFTHGKGAVDAEGAPRETRPVVQASGGEQVRPNLPRGSQIDIIV